MSEKRFQTVDEIMEHYLPKEKDNLPDLIDAFCEQFRKMIQLALRMDWIDCEDRMPEDGAEILFWDAIAESIEVGVYTLMDNSWHPNWAPTTIATEHITYWMPKPPDPEP